jgi:hypothetical protein
MMPDQPVLGCCGKTLSDQCSESDIRRVTPHSTDQRAEDRPVGNRNKWLCPRTLSSTSSWSLWRLVVSIWNKKPP